MSHNTNPDDESTIRTPVTDLADVGENPLSELDAEMLAERDLENIDSEIVAEFVNRYESNRVFDADVGNHPAMKITVYRLADGRYLYMYDNEVTGENQVFPSRRAVTQEMMNRLEQITAQNPDLDVEIKVNDIDGLLNVKPK